MFQLARRPELGAVGGLIVVTIFFAATADSSMFTAAGLMNVLSPAAQLGILAVGAGLLMIAGEFDLSIGSMVAFTGLVFAGPGPGTVANSDCASHSPVGLMPSARL